MKKELTLLALLVCLCQLTKAQTTDTSSYKHHFGIVASPTLEKVFTNNSSLPVGLIYKRQSNNNRMFRSTLIGSRNSYNQSVDVPNSTSSNLSTWNGFNVQLTVGYEWNMPLNNKWLLYYGAEAGPTYGWNNSKNQNPYFDSSGQGTVSHSQKYRTVGGIIRPFSGLAYQITDRLSIAAETAIVASFYRSRNKMIDEHITSGYQSSNEHSYKTDGSSINYKPISNISLLMRF